MFIKSHERKSQTFTKKSFEIACAYDDYGEDFSCIKFSIESRVYMAL